jgi:hypothetical protein
MSRSVHSSFGVLTGLGSFDVTTAANRNCDASLPA